jgi:hypothetical protein
MQIQIRALSEWGTVYQQGVHRVLQYDRDVTDAYDAAVRDGFTRIIFYVDAEEGDRIDAELQCLIDDAKALAYY